MHNKMLALEAMISDISDFARRELQEPGLAGPRFALCMKLSWYGQAGTPTRADGENLLKTLEDLRAISDDSRIDACYVGMTAAFMHCFPEAQSLADDAPAAIDELDGQAPTAGEQPEEAIAKNGSTSETDIQSDADIEAQILADFEREIETAIELAVDEALKDRTEAKPEPTVAPLADVA